MSVGCSIVFGFFLLVSLLFSIQDFERTVGSEYEQPVLQILVDIFGESGALALMTLIIICVWHCGLFSMTSNSRMMFGFSRDGGLPKFFNRVRVSLALSQLQLYYRWHPTMFCSFSDREPCRALVAYSTMFL